MKRSLRHQVLMISVGLAVGSALLLGLLADRVSWMDVWLGVGITLALTALPSAILVCGSSRVRTDHDGSHLLPIAGGVSLAVVAIVAIVLEIRHSPENGGYAADHPITVQVTTSVLVLFATYLVINQVVERRGSLRWKPATVQGLREIRTAVNYLDGLVFSLCLSTAGRAGEAGATGKRSRPLREAFVREWLERTLEDAETYESATQRSLRELTDSRPSLRDAFQTWVTLLVLNRDLQAIANSLPATIAAADQLTNVLQHRLEDPSSRQGAANAREVFLAVKRYEQARRATDKLLEQAVKP